MKFVGHRHAFPSSKLEQRRRNFFGGGSLYPSVMPELGALVVAQCDGSANLKQFGLHV
jgi:hypothetical protein